MRRGDTATSTSVCTGMFATTCQKQLVIVLFYLKYILDSARFFFFKRLWVSNNLKFEVGAWSGCVKRLRACCDMAVMTNDAIELGKRRAKKKNTRQADQGEECTCASILRSARWSMVIWVDGKPSGCPWIQVEWDSHVVLCNTRSIQNKYIQNKYITIILE